MADPTPPKQHRQVHLGPARLTRGQKYTEEKNCAVLQRKDKNIRSDVKRLDGVSQVGKRDWHKMYIHTYLLTQFDNLQIRHEKWLNK